MRKSFLRDPCGTAASARAPFYTRSYRLRKSNAWLLLQCFSKLRAKGKALLERDY